MKTVHVAAGIIRKEGSDELLAVQRGYGDMQGLWEFPGGKLMRGETPDVPSQGAQAPAPTHRPNLAREEDAGRRSPLGPILIAFMAGVIACSAIGNVWVHVEQQRKDAAKVEMSVEQSLSRTRSVHVSVEVKDGATWDTARGDSQMLIHIVGRTLRGQAIDEYQYVNSAGDGIELKPGDYELTVDEPPVATDGTRFRASKRMVPVSFNSQAPDTVDSTPQGGFDLYAIAQ